MLLAWRTGVSGTLRFTYITAGCGDFTVSLQLTLHRMKTLGFLVLLVGLSAVCCHVLSRREGVCGRKRQVANVGEDGCPNACPRCMCVVVGSDGNTYGNECQLQLEACRTGQTITVAQPCDPDNPFGAPGL